jgi:hypothetical protein
MVSSLSISPAPGSTRRRDEREHLMQSDLDLTRRDFAVWAHNWRAARAITLARPRPLPFWRRLALAASLLFA